MNLSSLLDTSGLPGLCLGFTQHCSRRESDTLGILLGENVYIPILFFRFPTFGFVGAGSSVALANISSFQVFQATKRRRIKAVVFRTRPCVFGAGVGFGFTLEV